MSLAICPECARSLRPCNYERHRRTHMPIPVTRAWGTEWLPPRRPITQGRRNRYDDFIPRGKGEHRFRIYRLRTGELEVIGSCRDADNFGRGLLDLHRRGKFIVDDSTGVLDTIEDPGAWIVHPFSLGRRTHD